MHGTRVMPCFSMHPICLLLCGLVWYISILLPSPKCYPQFFQTRNIMEPCYTNHNHIAVYCPHSDLCHPCLRHICNMKQYSGVCAWRKMMIFHFCWVGHNTFTYGWYHELILLTMCPNACWYKFYQFTSQALPNCLNLAWYFGYLSSMDSGYEGCALCKIWTRAGIRPRSDQHSQFWYFFILLHYSVSL